VKYFIFVVFLISFSITDAQSDWELQRDKHEIKVWTKDYPGSSFKQFKAQTRIRTSLENVVAVFLDIENMGLWYDRVEHVKLVKRISDMEGTYIIDFELPWPVANRISAVRATLEYLPDERKVIVKTQYEPGIVEDSETLIVTDIQSEWILEDENNGYISIYHTGYMNPSGSLPAWLANTGVKDGPIETLMGLREILPNYNLVEVPFLTK